jgi:hypothetical protein
MATPPTAAPRKFVRIRCKQEFLTVDAELKRNAKSVIDKILHLRDSL